MHFTPPEFRDHFAVQRGTVSFVEIKTVLGIFFMKHEHDAVAGDFRDDGGGGDDGDEFVAFDDCFV